MRRKFIGTLLLAGLMVSASSTFVSCKDYESDDLQELNYQLSDAFTKRIADLNDQINNLDNKYVTITQHETDKKALVDALGDSIKNVKDQIKELDAVKLNAADTINLSNRIDTLSNRVQRLYELNQKVVNTLITNVELQGTYSEGIGSVELPGYEPRMIVGFYGNFDNAVEFPQKGQDVDLVGKESYSGVVANDTIGKLYVTVNPIGVLGATDNQVDLALEKSNGDVSEVTLGKKLEPLTSVLNWGYTRAGAANVVSTPVILTKENIPAVAAHFNTAKLRQAIKNVLYDHSNDKADLKALAKAAAKFVLDNMDTNIPRLGIATTNLVQDDNLGLNLTRKNFGKMDILATTYRPVGFNALDNFTAGGVDDLEKLEVRVARIIDAIAAKAGTKYSNVEKINGFDPNNYKNVEVTINENGKTHTATVDLSGYSSELKNYALDEINKVIADLNGDDSYVASSALDYLNHFNSRYDYWYNRIKGAILKPVMLFKDGEGFHRFVAGKASVKAGEVTFVPTTYNYELIAPAYKKYVRIFGAGGNVVDKVYNGNERNIKVNLAAGTYTVVYQALDYTGKTAQKNYTLTVE